MRTSVRDGSRVRNCLIRPHRRRVRLRPGPGSIAGTPRGFPIGATVSIILPMSEGEVFVRTFEQGAGLTPAFGSGNSTSRAVLSQPCLAEPDQPVVVRNAARYEWGGSHR